jgi:putative oxidoreductase
MDKTYSTNLNLPSIDAALFILRLGAAVLILTHGIPKLLMLFGGGEITFADPIGLGMETSLTLAVFAEVICAVLLGLGLASRLAAIPLIITMAVAFFIVHSQDPFQVKELALIFLLIFTTLLITGSGKYSLDHYLLKKKKKTN